MHILFVDESGTPPAPNNSNLRYFVVGGIIIPENVWGRLRDALLGMKTRRKIRGEFKWRYFAPDNEDVGNPMRALPSSERDEIRAEIYRIICAERSVKSLAAICSVKAAYRMAAVTDRHDLYNLTYKVVTERFQYYLQDLTKETGREEFGIVVVDPRGGPDDKSLRTHHQKLLFAQAGFISKYRNLVESAFLQPSNLSIGIQLADMVAGAIWRKYERNDERFFKLMEPSLRRSKLGVLDGYGLMKVPKYGWE